MRLSQFLTLARSWVLLLFVALIPFFSGCIDDHDLEFHPDLDIEPSCSDGLKNGDETAIDCGGACKDICGDHLVAECSDGLDLNVVTSDDIDHRISFSRENMDHDYNWSGYTSLYAVDGASGDAVMIFLPFKKYPSGNIKFRVGETVNTQGEDLQAKVKVELDNFYYGRVSTGGELYLRVENEKIHIEFCEMRFKSEESRDNYIYIYNGNLNFLLSDTNK